MIKKWKLIMYSIVPALIILLVISLYLTSSGIFNEPAKSPKKPLSVDGQISDFAGSIGIMKEEASHIAYGEVVEQYEPSRASVVSVVKVSDTFKGDIIEEIVVFQLGQINEETVMEPKQKYLLFLGAQSETDKHHFFIKGGDQGLFLIQKGIVKPQSLFMQGELDSKFGDKVTFNKKKKSPFYSWLSSPTE